MRNLSFEPNALRAFVVLGWQRATAERAALIGRVLLYLLILVIFWQLWQATPFQELGLPDSAAADLLWYVAITEWIVFAAGNPYRSVEEHIRSGQIETALLRPLPYSVATLAEWVGAAAFHLLALGLCGVTAAFWLSGTMPITFEIAAPLVVAGGLGCAIVLLFQLQLGYAAAWIGASAPLFWIWQKLLFVFGGLLLPLTLYPDALREVAVVGPFAAILFAPASLILTPAPSSIAAILGQQVIWLLVILLMTALVDRATAARLVDRRKVVP